MSQDIMTARHRFVLSILSCVVLWPTAGAARTPAAAEDGSHVRSRRVDVARVRVEHASSRSQEQRGEPMSEEWSRVFKLPGKGSLDLSNVAGDIVVSGGPGDEIRVDAVKRVRAGRSSGRGELEDVLIHVNEGSGRVEIRTEFLRKRTHGEVDFTVHVPSYAAVNVRAVAGDVRLEKVGGEARVETVSGDVVVSDVQKLLVAKSVSGDVTVTGAAGDVINAESVSGDVEGSGLSANSCNVQSISGDITLTDPRCGGAHVKSISGGIEYAGGFAAGGRYEFKSHSGDVRLSVGDGAGFELVAKTFSGDLRTDLAMNPQTVEGSDRFTPQRNMRGTVGDGSAYVGVQTFSGSVVVGKRGAAAGQ